MITLFEIINCDYIFVMTNSHKQYLKQAFNATDKVFVLGDFVGAGEVNDPYGGTLEDYRECRNQLSVMVDTALKKLINK